MGKSTKKKKLIEDIIQSRNAIIKKYQALKSGRTEAEAQLKTTLKPITEPLEQLVDDSKVKRSVHEYTKLEPKDSRNDYSTESTPKQKYFGMRPTSTPLKYGETSKDEYETPTHSRTKSESTPNLSMNIVNKYFQLYLQNNPKIDYTYGIYKDKDSNEWKIGNSNIILDEENFSINGKSYKITLGLCELLFMRNPTFSLYNADDLEYYGDILNESNACRRGYSSDGQIKGNKSDKYKYIISKLLHHTGKGLMQIPKENIDYIYWNDPNELVERLHLLIASEQAGHNNHRNEIVSIIEELKEADIIV